MARAPPPISQTLTSQARTVPRHDRHRYLCLSMCSPVAQEVCNLLWSMSKLGQRHRSDAVDVLIEAMERAMEQKPPCGQVGLRMVNVKRI